MDKKFTMNYTKLIQEAYNEVMRELEPKLPPSTPNVELGDLSTHLAQFKGELATVLDKASRAGYISRDNTGKIVIKNKEAYNEIVGDLPSRIKVIQQQLEPSLKKEDKVRIKLK